MVLSSKWYLLCCNRLGVSSNVSYQCDFVKLHRAFRMCEVCEEVQHSSAGKIWATFSVALLRKCFDPGIHRKYLQRGIINGCSERLGFVPLLIFANFCIEVSLFGLEVWKLSGFLEQILELHCSVNLLESFWLDIPLPLCLSVSLFRLQVEGDTQRRMLHAVGQWRLVYWSILSCQMVFLNFP